MNFTTNGKELPANKETFINERKQFFDNANNSYLIVVKSSKRPLAVLNNIAMYSVAQVMDSDSKEIWHEFYPSILTEHQAKRIVAKLEEEPNRFNNEQQKGNHQG